MTASAPPRRRPYQRSLTIEERFQAKVHRRGPDDCWYWTGGTSNGVGSFRVAVGEVTSAHHYAKLLDTGWRCPPGMHPQHTCKTPDSALCCNPAHVIYARPGTTQTHPRGITHHSTRLTDQQVRDIRHRRCIDREPLRRLADEYHITVHYVWMLSAGRARTDVT